MKPVYVILIVAVLLSCNKNNNKDASKDSVMLSSENIAVERKNINPVGVKTYTETIKSFATTDEFKVALFETRETFHYRISINYKNLNEEDTLNVPDFGESPAVEILKGGSRPSCIVGFLDNDKKFRESKLIYFENDKIKVHVLKHYAVTTYQK